MARRAAFGLGAAALALAGCEATTGATAPAAARLQVAGAPVVVAGPPGFCIDSGSTRSDRSGVFVLLGDCGLLGGAPPSGRPVGAVLTASLEAAGGDEARAITDVERLAGAVGGLALAGEGGPARVLATRRGEGMVLVLIEGSGQPIPGLSSRFWRGFVDLGDRVAVISVLPFSGGNVDEAKALALAGSFAATLRKANGL